MGCVTTRCKTNGKPLLILCGLAGLLLLAAVVFAARFDINALKPKIEAAVSRATDIEVTIRGRIALRLRPPF
jgi:uncharacterized protein involved in outer membrane biogenesis